MVDTDNYILASSVRQYPVSQLSDRDVKIAHWIHTGTTTRQILHAMPWGWGGCPDNADSALGPGVHLGLVIVVLSE